ncbi:hypothetical protein BWQ96_01248 [Gracilariopsis chorda]|uniref:DDE-1 domain-containing protein n=1 Tax=Gracilariopsis chorda TaxID=448386 RepID=A0A2V3J380_9FLOR|nr:hypothetical protein BWQ96_01248 [Gracilariopsis chorda]|eukprot:PXF48906.1 hypothetical protein BWQ96_01248 [Gracilariopsis chorda]
MLAAVHGNGYKYRPLFVFQGTKLCIRRYQHRSDPFHQYLESIADCLSRGTLVTARKEVAAVDSSNFHEWATALMDDTKDLQENERKFLLIYDGYQSHLWIPFLELFREAGIIAYAIPSHTSGTTQSVDVSVFSLFKTRFGMLIEQCTKERPAHDVYDELDFCHVLTRTYENKFTDMNIKVGFQKKGVTPLEDYWIFAQTRPYRHEEPTKLASVDEMIKMLDCERKKNAGDILGDVMIHSQGFLDKK